MHPPVVPYQAKGVGLVQELQQGPVPADRRKFNDVAFAIIYGLCFILMIIFLSVSASKLNSLLNTNSRILQSGGSSYDKNFYLGIACAIFAIALTLRLVTIMPISNLPTHFIIA